MSKSFNRKIVTKRPKVENEIKMLSKIGYTLESAISDIVDNSVTAEAKKISITCPPGTKNIFWSIADDGYGMSPEELQENMVIGCKDPAEERDKMDLGRFGSGLKTASLSQAKVLTVISKKKGKPISGASWNVERIIKENDWVLEILSEEECKSLDYLEISSNLNSSGTQIIWEKIERYDEGDDHLDLEKEISSDVSSIKKHLSLYFHKFLERKKGIKLYVNKAKLKPVDPFMRYHHKSQEGQRISHNVLGKKIEIRGYTIPHMSHHSEKEKQIYGDPAEISTKQGLYIYRGDRLIVEGGWMGLVATKKTKDLSRIEINIPVELDHAWEVDVKKSTLKIPSKVREFIKNVIEQPIGTSTDVYIYKGKKESKKYWEKITNDREKVITYEIKKDNEALKELLSRVNKEQQKLLAVYLRNLEAYLPVNDILNTLNNNPRELNQDHLKDKHTELDKMFNEIKKKIEEENK